MKVDEISKSVLPQNDVEFLELMESEADWFVRNLDDFAQLISSSKNPLAKVDQDVVEQFKNGLKFNNGGLAGADYSMLEGGMSDKELLDLWEYFGISENLHKAYHNYECTGPGNCESNSGNICTNNC